MSQAPQTAVERPADAGASDARPLRADARRNHDRLLLIAGELFTERGTDVALEEIARRAGVGIGTLYRHFPTRDTLIEAVYRREVETLTDGIEDLLAAHDAETALVSWMRSLTRYVARKRGMAMALKEMLGPDNPLFAESHQRILGALSRLLDAAQLSGAIRSDVEALDLLRAMGGICMATDTPDWQDRTARLVDLLMDGLRFGSPNHPRAEAARA